MCMYKMKGSKSYLRQIFIFNHRNDLGMLRQLHPAERRLRGVLIGQDISAQTMIGRMSTRVLTHSQCVNRDCFKKRDEALIQHSCYRHGRLQFQPATLQCQNQRETVGAVVAFGRNQA